MTRCIRGVTFTYVDMHLYILFLLRDDVHPKVKHKDVLGMNPKWYSSHEDDIILPE